MESGSEIVFEVGAEGGSLRIDGRRGPEGVWSFRAVMRDRTLTMFEGIAGGDIRQESGWTRSWDEAMGALDRCSWEALAPLPVHRGFRERVYAAAEERWAKAPEALQVYAVARWQEACGMGSEEIHAP